jgi:hypothetical protein
METNVLSTIVNQPKVVKQSEKLSQQIAEQKCLDVEEIKNVKD